MEQAQFIVFDGGEMGRRVVLVRDPGTTVIGELVRNILLNPDHDEMAMRCEMLLYMAARAQMMAETIGPALAGGATVISDRFVSSTLAYQLGGDGLTADQIRAVAEIAIGGRWPDRTVILDMPAEASIARVTRAKDRIEQRPLDYHRRVRENYLAQAAAMPERYAVVRADRATDAVHADVMRAIGLVD
jgi:dTMP kinase